MGCFTSFARTSVALVALSLLVLQASGEEGFGSLCSECDVTDLLSQRWMEEEIGSF
jgi:hypothetical protein